MSPSLHAPMYIRQLQLRLQPRQHQAGVGHNWRLAQQRSSYKLKHVSITLITPRSLSNSSMQTTTISHTASRAQHGRILLVSHGWVIFAVAHLEGPQLPTREAGKLMHDDSEAVWAVQDGDPNFLHPVGWRTPQDHEVSTDYILELFLELSYFYSPLSLW